VRAASQAASPVSGLADHLGYWLCQVSNHVSHAFARALDGHGVTVAEWVVLRDLYDVDALAPSRLAAQLGLTRGAISKLADRLVAKGFVARHESSTDGRTHTLILTASGRRLVPALAALADRNDAEFFGHLTADDRQTLARVLEDIVARRGLAAVPID